jgi:hypothetical protein
MRFFNHSSARDRGRTAKRTSLNLLILEDRTVPTPVFTTPPFATFMVGGGDNTFQIQATGASVVTFSCSNLPAGVNLTPQGLLSGTPYAGGGAYFFIVSATDGVGPAATQGFSLEVDQIATMFTSPASTTFTERPDNFFQFTTNGFPQPTFISPSVSPVSPIPAGVHLSGSGALTGYPYAGPGQYHFIVEFPAMQEIFELNVVQNPQFINGPPNTTVVAGTPYSTQFLASGFPVPTFSVSGLTGSGINIDSTTGLLSGTPTAAKTYQVTVTAGNGATAETQFQLTVEPNAAASLLVTGPPAVKVGTAVSYSVVAHDAFGNVATGYTGPITFTTTDTTASATMPFDLINGAGSNMVTFNSVGTFDLTSTGPDPAGGVFSNTLRSIRSGLASPRLTIRR